jgi:UDPglucose 6-dehydrogenase
LIGNNSNHLNKLEGKTIGVLGLAFKANTDDIRESQPVDIIRMLQADGAKIKTYDPVAMENAGRLLKGAQLCEDAYDVAEGCDALIMATDWNEFKNLDWKRIKGLMKTAILVDGRNMYDPAKMKEIGFTYRGVGRGYV